MRRIQTFPVNVAGLEVAPFTPSEHRSPRRYAQGHERQLPQLLFADLVGFTALTAAEGDETAAELAVEFAD